MYSFWVARVHHRDCIPHFRLWGVLNEKSAGGVRAAVLGDSAGGSQAILCAVINEGLTGAEGERVAKGGR